MNLALFERLNRKGLISNHSLENVRKEQGHRQYYVFWELNILLYLGVLLLTGGFGALVYSNMNQVGHAAVLAIIGLAAVVPYIICLRKKQPFSTEKVESASPFLDYLLVFSSLCFVIFSGYSQYAYGWLGSHWGLASFLPLVFLFFTAYFFDHLGVLSLGITNLAAWAGIMVSPRALLEENDYGSARFIATGIGLGILMILAGRTSRRRLFKEHFAFTYTNFGMNLIYISCLGGLAAYHNRFYFWLPLLGIFGLYMYREALARKSFYFLLMASLYSYISVSWYLLDLPVWDLFGFSSLITICFYFIGSGIGMFALMTYMNRKFKSL